MDEIRKIKIANLEIEIRGARDAAESMSLDDPARELLAYNIRWRLDRIERLKNGSEY